jgi:hypothetical protein
MTRADKKNEQPICTVKLDRFTLTAAGSPPKQIPGFKRVKGFRPRPQGKLPTYSRVQTFCSTSNSARLSLQYKPVMPWLDDLRFTLIADDEDGISLDEVESVLAQCSRHKPSMVELACDFDPGSVVNRRFVLRHGRFGKTQRRKDRGGPGNLRYGSRGSPKLVRCYFKERLGRYRIELEIHSGLLRKLGIASGYELGRLASQLLPAHFQFVGFRWDQLRAHLVKKFGQVEADLILEEARERSDSSLRDATRYLSQSGVTNVHRFFGRLKLNRPIQSAMSRWAKRFPVDDEMMVETK